MGNSLLDFVMSLARDPEVAAHYAADPAGALAAAGLPGVTTADVSSLLPMVTDSLAMSSPGFGVDPTIAADAANVWASGAATAAFDAFGIEAPAPAHPAVAPVNSIEAPEPASPTDQAPLDGPSLPEATEMPPAIDPAGSPAPDWADHPGLVVDPHPGDHNLDVHPHDPTGFDLF